MARPDWTPGRSPLPSVALTPVLLAADQADRSLFIVGGVLVVIAVIAIALGVWGGRRRK